MCVIVLGTVPILYTVRNVLPDFAVYDWRRYYKALCDVKSSQIEGNGRKFSHIELGISVISLLTVYLSPGYFSQWWEGVGGGGLHTAQWWVGGRGWCTVVGGGGEGGLTIQVSAWLMISATCNYFILIFYMAYWQPQKMAFKCFVILPLCWAFHSVGLFIVLFFILKVLNDGIPPA